MKEGAEVFKLQRKPRGRIEERIEGSSLDSAISEILIDFTEKCVKDKGNLHITGEDVCLVMKELNERACKEPDRDVKSKDSPLSELKLFSQIEHYYRFHIIDRKYQSFRIEFETQDEEENKAAIGGKFNDLIFFANDPNKDKANEANAFNLCSVLIQHIYQTLNPGNDADQFIQHGECRRETGSAYRKSGYIPLNDYHKSELLTWNRLLQDNGTYSYSAYPYCKFQELDDLDRIVLLIVTKLDTNYVDTKVKKVDKIEPIHMIVLKSQDLIHLKKELNSIEFKLRHAIGYLSYGVLAGRTDESLATMSIEAALVARHWYSTGIEQLFTGDEQEEYITGMQLSKKIVEEMLCADVKGLETLEVFPFDRVYLFSGSNFKAIDKDPISDTRQNSSMKLTVLEAAVKSLRPQDNDRFLSTMERLEKKADSDNDKAKKKSDRDDKKSPDSEKKSDFYEQPSLEIFFDVTQKRISYQTDCLINPVGSSKELELKTVDNTQKDEFERILKNLDEESVALEEDKEKINAVIKTLFSGFTGGDDAALQAYCQRTYQFYDEDGLCLLSDFGVKVKDIHALKKIQDAYFNIFFEKEKADWRRIWTDNPQNEPYLKGFKDWLEEKESKVVLISFDPYQNLSNMDQEGKRYLLDNDSFTMILVADEDIVKNNFDLQTEILDLKQMLLMVIRRKLREEQMKKEVIRGQKRLFTTMMSAIMHRFKHFIPEINRQNEIDDMRKRFERIFKAEDYSATFKEFPSIHEVYEYFLAPFINKQLGEETDKMKDQSLNYKFKMACIEYLKKCKSMKKIENIDPGELEIKFNKTHFPNIRIKVQDDFVEEAINTLINNAVEHTAMYSNKNKTGNKAEIIISFNLSPLPGNDLYSFELSIINSSRHIPQQKLKILNSPVPKQSPTDSLKATSTGIGIFIARTQLQKSIGKGADIRLDNVGENFVEAKLIFPAKRVQRFQDDMEEEIEILPQYTESGYVLYVEDEIEIQKNSNKALVKLLGDESKLFTCDNKKQALGVIGTALPAIILLDLSILRAPGEPGAVIDYALDVIADVVNKNGKTPIVILSQRLVKEIEELLVDRINNLGEYQIEIKDFDKQVDIQEKTIVIPSYEIKRLSEDEGKGLMSTMEKWLKQNINLETKRDETGDKKAKKKQLKNELPFLIVNFNDNDFNEKLKNYHTRNVSDHIPDEIFIAAAEVDDEKTLFESMARWFAHPGLRSFYKDEQDSSQCLPLTRNERFRTIFLDIQIADTLETLIDLKFRYWCLPHNILISKHGAEVNSQLAWDWKFTPHGVRGTLSNLRHDIKNKLSISERKEIIEQIDAVEKLLLFEDDELSPHLRRAFKNKDKSILEVLKNRTDKVNVTVKDLFEKLNNVFYQKDSSDQIRGFHEKIERLQEFLEK